jgi:creatinine amidohydrolase
MQLPLSTWAEIEQFLQRNRSIVVPIGSNEQHGPTGLLGTDWLCPEIIAREAGKTADILVAPTFNIGMAQHHLAFPGTISLRPTTFIAAIVDWVRSLSGHGFEKILFLNGHGGNIASIEAAFSEIYAESSFTRRRAGFALKLCNWWDLEGVGELAREQFPEGHGSHATPSEIAITQWAFPELQKTASFSPAIAPNGPIREALDFRGRFPDGRIGSNPGLATPEKGGALVALAARGLVKELDAFRNESTPQ